MERNDPVGWAATLTPHRSLSRRGFIIVMALIAAVNFVAGAFFYAIGAWPVAGFCGFDVLIMYWAFNRNFADARQTERIEITPHELVFERSFDGRPTECRRFVRRWVRVELEEDRNRELIGRLFLNSHGRSTEIGRFLAPEERRTLARALREALASPFV